MTEETERERVERNYADLLQEMRVAQTGVQILFAFLLTLPFAARFVTVTGFDKVVYGIALISAAMASALIIAPVAHHRVMFRRGQKPQLVFNAHWMATGGLVLLFVAMVCAVLLVTDVVFGEPVGVILTTVTALWFAAFWGVIPWVNRR